MKRWRAIVLLGVLALAVVVAAVFWPVGPRPCRATFEQVREGMTYEKVCTIVGGPPGDHSDGCSRHGDLTYFTFLHASGWLADDAQIWVWFDSAGRVLAHQVGDVCRVGKPSEFDRIRARLGL